MDKGPGVLSLPNQIAIWKKQALERLPGAMAGGRNKDGREPKPVDEDSLHRKSGKQGIEIDYLKKKCVSWDGSNATSGLYFYRMQTTDYSLTWKMTIIK